MANRSLNINDENFQQNVVDLLEDFSDDDVIGDPNFCLESTHESMSEEECDSEDCNNNNKTNEREVSANCETSTEEASPRLQSYFYGKNGFKWSAVEPKRFIKTPLHNIIRLPVVRYSNITKEMNNEYNFWSIFFDDEIMEILLTCTNKKLNLMRIKYKNPQEYSLKDLDNIELKAFLGLLVYSSVFKSNHEDLNILFSTEGYGRDIFRATMSKKRFEILLCALRFDDIEKRKENLKTDSLIAISNIFNKVINNCQKYYSIGTHACIDEMLVPFRGRCSFKMYMPNKPAKYGIKILALTDARNNYLANAYIYSGKKSDGIGLTDEERTLSIPTQSVLRLSKIIQGTNRSITADNWFTLFN